MKYIWKFREAENDVNNEKEPNLEEIIKENEQKYASQIKLFSDVLRKRCEEFVLNSKNFQFKYYYNLDEFAEHAVYRYMKEGQGPEQKKLQYILALLYYFYKGPTEFHINKFSISLKGLYDALPAGDKAILNEIGEVFGVNFAKTLIGIVKGAVQVENTPQPKQKNNEELKELKEKIKKEFGIDLLDLITSKQYLNIYKLLFGKDDTFASIILNETKTYMNNLENKVARDFENIAKAIAGALSSTNPYHFLYFLEASESDFQKIIDSLLNQIKDSSTNM